ncbi:unnamed protein product, partial [Musa hybrid cultivar]
VSRQLSLLSLPCSPFFDRCLLRRILVEASPQSEPYYWLIERLTEEGHEKVPLRSQSNSRKKKKQLSWRQGRKQ